MFLLQVRQQQQQWLAAGEDHSSSCQDLLQQLGYREYGRYLSFHFPFFHEHAMLSDLRGVPWRLDNRAFKVGCRAGIQKSHNLVWVFFHVLSGGMAGAAC